MNRQQRIHKKQEKRIVKLLYRKGMVQPKELDSFFWDEGYADNLPEIIRSTYDSWSCECSESPLVDEFRVDFYFSDTKKDEFDIPEMIYKIQSRPKFIKYLQTLPTIRHDAKINRVLVAKLDY